MPSVPASRIRSANQHPLRADGRYVLYWMVAFRRLTSNFALERAVEHARELDRPLLIFEALRCDYRWANDRLHQFVIEGMAANARAIESQPARYFPYVEPAIGAGCGLLETLARDASVVVTDDFPSFFVPRMIASAASRVPVRVEAVDSNGVLPMRGVDAPFSTAYAFRAHLQRTLRDQLGRWPAEISFVGLRDPAAAPLDPAIAARWPSTPPADLENAARLAASLPIDHGVAPAGIRGGHQEALATLRRFVIDALPAYVEDHNQPEVRGTSGLSPYLHFGHISPHEVFAAVMTAERWTSRKLPDGSSGRPGPRAGSREGWWGVRPGAEAFLDQLITWRELGYNMCATRPDDYAAYASLPSWARATLDAHRTDTRRNRYTRAQFEHAETHDEVWNAAQRQLTRDGWMHNYLRMLWGKKILEWTTSPEEALETMIEVMNKHALDGRDPNSYTGYLWTLGRYDRPWAPEREVYGTVRYMSSANTVKKLRLKNFLKEYGPGR